MALAHPAPFGSLLRRYRRAAGLTQEALAERAGLSVRGISDLERGVNRTPRHDTTRLLAEALTLPPEQLLPFEAAAHQLSTGTASFPQAAPATHLWSMTPAWGDAASPPLVGRARELALLAQHLASHGPPVLVLAGEPGIGKTRLLSEAVGLALDRGWTVLQGGCQRRGAQEPYAPLVEAIERHLRLQSGSQSHAALQGCAWLVRLLPELLEQGIDPVPAWTVPAVQERRLMFGAVVRYVANVAGAAGTLLVLDDLQWAGVDALDLLATLVRSVEAPLRVVGAYRDTEVQPGDLLAVALADLAHARLVTQRTLPPLSTDEVGQLLDAVLEERGGPASAVRERVAQRTGGVPFFVLSCVQGWRSGEVAGGADDTIPWDVTQSIRQRVAALPDVAQEMLDAAAVVGRVIEPALLTAATARPEREVLDALDAALRARLLQDEARTYHFAHDVIREVIEGDLGVARRMALHRHVAEAYERTLGEPAATALAYHYAHSDAPDKAVLYLETAGDQALAQHANTVARGYYQDAVDHLDRLGGVAEAEAARVREKLGDDGLLAEATWSLGLGLDGAGRDEEARRITEEASRLAAATGDLDMFGRSLNNLMAFSGSRGDLAAAQSYADRAVAVAEQLGEPSAIAFFKSNRGHNAFVLGAWEPARRDFEQAVVLSRQSDASWRSAPPLLGLGQLCLVEGAWDDVSRYLQEAIAMAERVNNRDILLAAHALLAERDVLDGCPADASARLARAMEPCEWDTQVRMRALTTLAWAQVAGGDAAEAGATVAPVVAYARDENLAFTLIDALCVQALAALRQAHWEETEQALQEGLALAQRLQYPYAEARLLSVCGLLHAQKNEVGPARERWEAALAIFQRLGARKDAARTCQLFADRAAYAE